jgi:PKD repeat protein
MLWRVETVVTKRILIGVATAALAACSLDKQVAPALTGPSELALSLQLTASPDLITQDGISQSVVTVLARDAYSQPVRGLSMHVDIFANGTQADFGTVSSKSISTGNDGRASLSYMSPPPPPASVSSDTLITLLFTPVGTDYANTTPRAVNIRLTRPGVILPPNGAPKPFFFFSPGAPHENESVLFDASGSTDDGQIVSYAWTFGDGATATGVRPVHAYAVAGSYGVILTVTDDRGLSASTAPTQVNVLAAVNPTAAFVSSPAGPAVGDTVYFDASKSSVAPGRTIDSYAWDFGDGSRGGGQTPSHVYGKAATYTVTLTVTDSTGRTDTTSQSLTIR